MVLGSTFCSKSAHDQHITWACSDHITVVRHDAPDETCSNGYWINDWMREFNVTFTQASAQQAWEQYRCEVKCTFWHTGKVLPLHWALILVLVGVIGVWA